MNESPLEKLKSHYDRLPEMQESFSECHVYVYDDAVENAVTYLITLGEVLQNLMGTHEARSAQATLTICNRDRHNLLLEFQVYQRTGTPLNPRKELMLRDRFYSLFTDLSLRVQESMTALDRALREPKN